MDDVQANYDQLERYARGLPEAKPAAEYNRVVAAYELAAYEKERLTTLEGAIWNQRQALGDDMKSIDIMAAIKRGRDRFREAWVGLHGDPRDIGAQPWFDEKGKVMR